MLDLSDMGALEIDVEGRTAWAESGLTAGAYSVAVGEHGLATGFGDVRAHLQAHLLGDRLAVDDSRRHRRAG